MTSGISKRLHTIKKLVREYLLLEKGVSIEKHAELLRVFDISGSVNKKHPHKNKRVYISRRALKHYVESRKEELGKHHAEDDVIDSIYFVIDHLQETVIDFEHYEYVPPERHFYTKDFYHLQKSKIRVLVEEKGTWLEVRSVHFRK